MVCLFRNSKQFKKWEIDFKMVMFLLSGTYTVNRKGIFINIYTFFPETKVKITFSVVYSDIKITYGKFV